MNAQLTLNLVHQTLTINHTFNPWQSSNPVVLTLSCSLILLSFNRFSFVAFSRVKSHMTTNGVSLDKTIGGVEEDDGPTSPC